MHIEIKANIQVSESLQEHIEAKLELALRRVYERVAFVTVRINDVNGPRGGVDKRCRILLTMGGHAPIVVEASADDVYAAVTHAAARLDEQAARAVSRQRRRPGHARPIREMLRDAS